MMSRAASLLLFFANLVAFSVCAMIAFARNVNALFYHFDGSYLLVDARDQLKFGQPSFEYSSNFLQSIGNIQLPQNARLLAFYWPLGWFSDTQAAKVACYLIIAAIVFVTAYWLARLLSQPQTVALAAGWILGVCGDAVRAGAVLLSHTRRCAGLRGDCCSAGRCVLVDRIGRAARRACSRTPRLHWAWPRWRSTCWRRLRSSCRYLQWGCCPMSCWLWCSRARRSELLRKLAVLAAVAIDCRAAAMALVRARPIFIHRAEYLFPVISSLFIPTAFMRSVLFHYGSFGLAGPLLVFSSVFGAFLSLRSADARLRAAAWILLALVATFLVAGIALSLVPHWIFPPPIYFEGAAWPLYAMFSAITLNRGLNFIAGRIAVIEASERLSCRSTVHPSGGGFCAGGPFCRP